MYILTQGNLLLAHTEAIVNPVNTVGVMGKGLALQFRNAYPENYREYKQACELGYLSPGKMFIHCLPDKRYIINFPTKRHWSKPSRMDYIALGLKALVADVQRLGIKSVAIPPLGCGLGGLPWVIVKELMIEHFIKAPNVYWFIFEPQESQ
jgi:O-acetyl-ADP-ribose deacetylase (regulator of RNase III)